MSSLSLRGVSLRHPGSDTDTVSGIDCDVPAGSLTVLVGPSGSGKTTVLNLAAGLLVPDAGEVLIDNRVVTSLPAEMRPIGMVFQSNALFPHLTVLENIEFAIEASGATKTAARLRASLALELASLSKFSTFKPSDLSGGQQQRVVLARALVHSPSVLLLDEPLSSVDSVLRRSLLDELRTLQKRQNLAVVYVTHDHREALALGDQVVLLHDGRVEQAGSPKDLYERPTTAFAASFMGEAEIFQAWRNRYGDVFLGPLQLPLRLPGKKGAIQLAVRPHAWQLKPATSAGLAGSVTKRTYFGKTMEYQIQTEIGTLSAFSRPPTPQLDIGAPVSLHCGAHGFSVLDG